jgi:hypothetical protein
VQNEEHPKRQGTAKDAAEQNECSAELHFLEGLKDLSRAGAELLEEAIANSNG